MNIIKEIYDDVSNNIIWDKAENNKVLKPYIDILKERGYNSKWHNEGSVWNHTKLVVEEICKIYPWEKSDLFMSDLRFWARKKAVLSAFFHDFGKAIVGFQKENGDWSFPQHDYAGDKLIREILWDDKSGYREVICYGIKNHMRILQIADSKNVKLKVSELCKNKYFMPIKMLINLKRADCRGSKMTEYDNSEEKLDAIEQITIDNNTNMDKNFNVFIMCGISGSGKSTYITNNFPNIKVISRDIIREELNISKKGEKVVGNRFEENKVTKLEYEYISKLCKERTDFVIDDMNLQKKYRAQLINYIKPYNPNITIIYVEAPSIEDNIKRRNGMVDGDIIKSMIKKLDFPTESECDKLIIYKQ